MFRFFSAQRGFKKSKSSRQKELMRKTLRFETMEAREMMAADLGSPLVLPQAEGSIQFDPTSGYVTIHGSSTLPDNVLVKYENDGNDFTPERVVVSLKNINFPQTASFDWAAVKGIHFYGYGGNDRFDNRTQITSYAEGGADNDTLLGGSDGDLLNGGIGSDYIDGRQGDDSLIGDSGLDTIFGDEGHDWLYGGIGNDFLFGGHGNDNLNGDGGSDRLYGGADGDTLTDSSSTVKFTDYGPNETINPAGFRAFDWFDKNMEDAEVRSMFRESYRSGSIHRIEMLDIYGVITDQTFVLQTPFNLGAVSAAELRDLNDMIRVGVQWDDGGTRYFVSVMMSDDAANNNYQGGALGKLKAGSSAENVNNLVDKWFFGGDVPAIGAGDGGTYQVVSGTLFRNGIHQEDIDQGATSNCYFLAALGEVGLRKPTAITSMFKDNLDGTYTLKFMVSGGARYVTVNMELPVDVNGNAIYAGWGGGNRTNPNNELWVALAEKAYAQLNESGLIGQDGTNSYDGFEFGNPGDAFYNLLGTAATDHSTTENGEAKMAQALKNGMGVTVSTKSSSDGVNSLLVPGHAYMVLSYNATTKRFLLYNPHGFTSGFPTYVEVSWKAISNNCKRWTSVATR